jgi:hypothetical protein
MTYIPNAREGENGYKDSDLKGERAAFLRGYDAAIEDILCLEGNLEVYSGESLLIHYLEENEDKAAELFSAIKHWSEMQRNTMAVALLDEQYNEDDKEEA